VDGEGDRRALISTATLTPPTFFTRLIGSGFSFGRKTRRGDPADRWRSVLARPGGGAARADRLAQGVLAMTGRRQVIGELTGHGGETLRPRP